MMRSIRVRLTAWYVGVLALATFVLGGASWWLSTQSVVRATDVGLVARIEGVRGFLNNPRTRLTVRDLQDEFSEYAELTRGEALLEVIGPSDVVLCRPSVPGWLDMKAAVGVDANAGSRIVGDRDIAGQPYRVAVANIALGDDPYVVTVAAPMGPAYAALNRFHRWLLILLPIVLIIAAGGGYAVSRRALTPVDRMTSAVRTITVDSLSYRLDVPPVDDELSRLASTFNEMLARLDVAIRDIVRFTSDASLELRTPVALLRTTAELALRHPRSAQEYRQALADVASHAQHMSALVDDLLVLARTDAGLESHPLRAVDVRHILERTHRDMNNLAASRSVRVDIDVPATPVIIEGDSVGLQRLFVILLDNAVRYSSPGGLVRISQIIADSAEGAGRTIVEIRDDGIGLDGVDRLRLFERFFRGTRARQHAPDGTGLGLSIAQTIVARHGGSIEIGPADVSTSHGCSVRVVLPTMTDVMPTAASVNGPAAESVGKV